MTGDTRTPDPPEPDPFDDLDVQRQLREFVAARPAPDTGLREALDWMAKVIDAHTDECVVLRRASEGGAETDLDSAFGDVRAALAARPAPDSDSEPICPDCRLTARRIGEFHINAQKARNHAD